jgi:hypothetical protein
VAPSKREEPEPRVREAELQVLIADRQTGIATSSPAFPETQSLEAAFLAGACRALRRRAAALRLVAEAATTVVDHHGRPISIRTPEAAHARRVAADWDHIAGELDGGQ